MLVPAQSILMDPFTSTSGTRWTDRDTIRRFLTLDAEEWTCNGQGIATRQDADNEHVKRYQNADIESVYLIVLVGISNSSSASFSSSFWILPVQLLYTLS